MKIRTGFVSNSSSSSYVIAISNDIDSLIEDNKDKIIENVLECMCDDIEEDFDDISELSEETKNNLVNRFIESFKSSFEDGVSCFTQYDDDDGKLYNVVSNLFYHQIKGTIELAKIESGSSGDGSVTLITKDALLSKIKGI
jgi:hypothetical protein